MEGVVPSLLLWGEPVAVHVCASCAEGLAQGQLPTLTRACHHPAPSLARGAICKALLSTLLLVGTAPSSVHSEDVFCSHRNRCTSEGGRQKNEAEQKCAV